MKYNSLHKKIKLFLGILGLVIIPIYSVMYAINGDPLLVTFSAVGGRYNKQPYLILWGILLSVFFFVSLSYLFIITRMENNKIKMSLTVGSVLLLVSVIVPFIPSMYPIISEIHNNLAYITAIFGIFVIYAFVLTLQKLDKKLYKRSLNLLNIVVLITVIIFLLVGSSSVFQIHYSVGVCFFLFLLIVMIERSNLIDIENVLKEKEEEIKKLYKK